MLIRRKIRCACGCGQITPVATYHAAKRGYIRGKQLRFIRGHNARKYRLHNGYTVDPDTGCWIWHSGPDRYGRLTGEDGTPDVLAHRASFEKHKGPIPEGLLVCHTCDVKGCINPSHLFAGTYSENTKDCVAKGRWPHAANYLLGN